MNTDNKTSKLFTANKSETFKKRKAIKRGAIINVLPLIAFLFALNNNQPNNKKTVLQVVRWPNT
jgi:hypothetical protein